jgi:hypothetical protein
MMPSLHSAYGVEYSGGKATVVRIQKGKRTTPEVLACGMDVTADPRWKELTARISRDQESGQAMVASVAFAHDSFLRPLTAPFASLKKARAVFPSLLDVQLPFPLEQCRYAFTRQRPGPDGAIRGLAVAVPQERLVSILDSLRSLGIDPEWITQEALTLWRFATRQRPGPAARPCIVMYLGEDRTVVVAGNDREPASALGIRSAWITGPDSAAQDKTTTRIRQFLAGNVREAQVERLEFLITGPLASRSEPMRDGLGIDAARWQVVEQPETFLARALADRLLDTSEPSDNLRTGDLAHPHTRRASERRENRLCLAVAASAVLLALAGFMGAGAVEQQHRTLQKSIQAGTIALTGNPAIPRGQELFIAAQHVEQAAKKLEGFSTWLEPSAYPLLASTLRHAQSRGITLESLSIRPRALVARGSGPDWQDPEYLVIDLTRLGWHSEIERRDAGRDERIPFVVRAQP